MKKFTEEEKEMGKKSFSWLGKLKMSVFSTLRHRYKKTPIKTPKDFGAIDQLIQNLSTRMNRKKNHNIF